MKILWHSNAPWTKTGYGIQTSLIGNKISSLGHEIHYSANYGLQGVTVALDDKSRIYPSLSSEQRDYFLLPYHAKNMEADIVITLYDVWTIPQQITTSFRWVPMVPIQWEKTPEYVKYILQGAFRVIAYSRFGVDKLRESGIDAYYLPHCLDGKIYRYHEQKDARDKLGIPNDIFFAVMVGMNKGFPSRKSFPETLDAWSKFIVRHPDSRLHLHTSPRPISNGVDINAVIGSLDLPEGAITIPDIYEYLNTIDSEKMALLYSAADVLLLPSRAEGFGVPLIEAQACGCPVITSDFGPMRELCMSGWLVDGQRDWDQGLQQWQFLPFSHSILSSLEQAYQGKVSGKNAQMRNHASVMAKEYDVEVVTREYLVPVLESLEEAVGGVGSLDILQEL